MEVVKLDSKIERFQAHLSLIRKTAGLTLEKLGDKVEVSRQMISRLENHHCDMTMMQYRALRQVFDEEISNHPEDTRILQDVLIILIDHPENFSPELKQQVLSNAYMLAPALVGDEASQKDAISVWDAVLAGAMVSADIFSSLPLFGSTAAIIAGTVSKFAKQVLSTIEDDIQK